MYSYQQSLDAFDPTNLFSITHDSLGHDNAFPGIPWSKCKDDEDVNVREWFAVKVIADFRVEYGGGPTEIHTGDADDYVVFNSYMIWVMTEAEFNALGIDVTEDNGDFDPEHEA